VTYFKDMTVCTYFDRAGQSEWACRLMAIGWLEKTRDYTKGEADVALLETLKSLRVTFNAQFPGIRFRGLHICSLCAPGEDGERGLSESHINLFIPTRGFVYVAPGRIDHYIEAHGYAPPESFVGAVMDCPAPASEEFRALMAVANRNIDAPIFRHVGQDSGGGR
jgi:hypothetical protein